METREEPPMNFSGFKPQVKGFFIKRERVKNILNYFCMNAYKGSSYCFGVIL
jgi:hypothetical protein